MRVHINEVHLFNVDRQYTRAATNMKYKGKCMRSHIHVYTHIYAIV